LRREAKRGRLTVEVIAGKTFTTLNEIERMRGRCRVEVRVPVSTSDRPATGRKAYPSSHLGHPWTARDITPLDALNAKLQRLSKFLKDYIAKKYAPTRKEQDLEKIPSPTCFRFSSTTAPDLYVENSDAQKYLNRIERLKEFWGKLMLSEVTRTKCREYQQHRGNKGGARRDLEDLRAAIANHAAEGLHRGIVKVTLPKKGPARDRWLTRDEAAHLIWTCWRAREIQTMHRGPNKGQQVETSKRPLRHLARFILIGVYSGNARGRHCVSIADRGYRAVLCRP